MVDIYASTSVNNCQVNCILLTQYCYFDQQEQLLGSLDNFEPEVPDTEDDEVRPSRTPSRVGGIPSYTCYLGLR